MNEETMKMNWMKMRIRKLRFELLLLNTLPSLIRSSVLLSIDLYPLFIIYQADRAVEKGPTEAELRRRKLIEMYVATTFNFTHDGLFFPITHGLFMNPNVTIFVYNQR